LIFVNQNLIYNWLTYAKSTGDLISFGCSDCPVRSLVSAKRSANRSVQTKKRLHFLADIWSQSEFRTQRNVQRKTDPKSEMTRCLVFVSETLKSQLQSFEFVISIFRKRFNIKTQDLVNKCIRLLFFNYAANG